MFYPLPQSVFSGAVAYIKETVTHIPLNEIQKVLSHYIRGGQEKKIIDYTTANQSERQQIIFFLKQKAGVNEARISTILTVMLSLFENGIIDRRIAEPRSFQENFEQSQRAQEPFRGNVLDNIGRSLSTFFSSVFSRVEMLLILVVIVYILFSRK